MTRVICFWIATKRQFCLSIYSLPISFSHTLFICLLQLTLCLVKSQSSSVARSDALQSLRWTIARKRHAVYRFAKTLAVVLATSSDHAVNVVVRATARKWHAVLNLALNSATVSHHAVIMVLRTTAIKWHATILAVTPATTSHHALTMIISKFPARILKMTAMACHHVEERWSGVFKLSIQEIQKRLSASRFVSATLWCHALIKNVSSVCKGIQSCGNKMIGRFPVVKLDSEGPCCEPTHASAIDNMMWLLCVGLWWLLSLVYSQKCSRKLLFCLIIFCNTDKSTKK